MALGGGTFLTMNKILPGSYVNFVSAARATALLSDRGYAAMPLELDWGPENQVFTLKASDFEKSAPEVFGYPFTHEKLRGLRDLFRNLYTGFFYRLGGGLKAQNEFAEAKWSGTRGNALKVIIEAAQGSKAANPLFEVSTWLDGAKMDLQVVSTAADLHENAYLAFKAGASLTLTAGAPLTGGTNTPATNADYQSFLDKIEPFSFNVLGCLSTDSTVKTLFSAFTKRMRESAGVKFQTVLHRYPLADYEGIISVENGLSGAPGDPGALWWVVGAEASCPVNKSLTNRRYDGEFSIDVPYTQTQLEEGVQSGKLLFHQVGGEIRVLTDSNTFVSVSSDKGADFGANQTVRILDQIANDVAVIFNTRYLGVTPNDASGRISLWNDLVRHHQRLQDLRALQDFLPEHITVAQGETKKSVVVTDRVSPVNCMEQLYMTVIVQ